MNKEETNKEIAWKLLDAMRAGDAVALADILAEDFINHNPTAQNGLQNTQALLAAVGPIKTELYRTIAEADYVVTHARFTYTHPATHHLVDNAAIDIWKVKDGKIVEHWDVLEAVPDKTASGQDMFSELSK